MLARGPGPLKNRCWVELGVVLGGAICEGCSATVVCRRRASKIKRPDARANACMGNQPKSRCLVVTDSTTDGVGLVDLGSNANSTGPGRELPPTRQSVRELITEQPPIEREQPNTEREPTGVSRELPPTRSVRELPPDQLRLNLLGRVESYTRLCNLATSRGRSTWHGATYD
jgi:hypothetical protein